MRELQNKQTNEFFFCLKKRPNNTLNSPQYIHRHGPYHGPGRIDKVLVTEGKEEGRDKVNTK